MRMLCCQMAATPGVLARNETPATPAERRIGWHEFNHTRQWLKLGCPSAMPVVVCFTALPETVLGNCVRANKRFVIRLNKLMNEHQACEVLVHEWSHALAWNYALDALTARKNVSPAEFELICHDETWGCSYSRAWRVYTAALQAFDHQKGAAQ